MDGIELTGLQTGRDNQTPAPLAPADLPAFRAEVEAFAAEAVGAGIHFHEPPFVLAEDPTPAALAEALTFVFYKIAGIDGPRLSLAWRLVSAFAASKPELAALKAAGELIAADFDRGLGNLNDSGYHNSQHTFEVLYAAHTLILLKARSGKALSPEARLTLLLAALIHDWHHDGSEHPDGYFHLENLALTAARPYLADLTPAQLQRIELIVRATDSSGPHGFARQIYEANLRRLSDAGLEDEPSLPALPDGMDALAELLKSEQAEAAELAVLLGDASLLPAAGLTPDYAAVHSQRLRDEWAHPVGHGDFVRFVARSLSRPPRPTDSPDLLPGLSSGHVLAFSSEAGSFFTGTIQDVMEGHEALLREMGEADNRPTTGSIDLSAFQAAQADITRSPGLPLVSLEDVAAVRANLEQAGFFEAPPFTLTMKSMEKLVPGTAQDLMHRINLADHTDEALQRLHVIPGPVLSAVIAQLFDTIGLRIDDPVYRAAASIAREIDQGLGIGTADDLPDGEPNPYHNHKHIIDIVLLCDLLGQRATQRAAPASSPLARALLVLAALVCHWHHTGKGNRVDGEYRMFYLQDRALGFSRPHTGDMSKELRQSLEILVRTTDPREAYSFSRAAYAFHVGLGARPDIPAGCESLARLLGDPALCTLAARLNDVLYIPFAGLGSAYSARSMVQLGREIGQVIDFNFVRKHLITPMLSRPLYPGEHPHPALLVSRTRVASFTSAEAQAIFNPAMQALLVAQARKE
jgi:hypothetical protein